jgi:hypothetical protein
VLVILGSLLVGVAAFAQADLPNANLPGNSPSLPNSNLPGSMPTDNPIYLPDSDTSPAVGHYGPSAIFQPGSNLPLRNPTLPPSPDEQAAARPQDERQQLQLLTTMRELAAAREQAAKAHEEAAAAKDEAAAARDEAAAARAAAAAKSAQPPK